MRRWRTSSYAVISRTVQFVLSALILVSGAALEEMLPKIFGVGVPVLLASVLFLSVRQTGPSALAFAVVAGAVEDALSALPPMTSVSWFLGAALLLRRFGSAGFVPAVAYAGYQVWLSVWVSSIGGDVFKRVLLACPVAFATAFVADATWTWLYGKAAADERV